MSSRLVFDNLPSGDPATDPKWADELRRVLGASFRSLREVLDASRGGGVRMREQFRCVDCVIDTGRTPHTIVKVPWLKSPPLAVWLLSARQQPSTTGEVISAAALRWEMRGAAIVIHGAATLSAATRYDCVIAVME